jgi:hypothetical protein
MATIDIGKLTFTHKGDYAGGTAYVANDVVYYNGSAYVAKTSTTGNLPTSTAHWNTFTAGSGGIWNSGLSLGTAGQVVQVNSGASALEFGTVSSDAVKVAEFSHSGSTVTNFSLDNIFSTTYPVYRIILHNMLHNSTGAQGWIRAIDNNGTVDTGSSYEFANNGRTSGGSDLNGSSSSAQYVQLTQDLSSDTEKTSTIVIDVVQPYQTSAYKWFGTHSFFYCNNSSDMRYMIGGGVWKNNTNQMRGLQYTGQGTSNIIKQLKAVVYGFKGAY